MDSIKLSPEIEQYIQESDKNRNYSQFTPDERLKGDKEREFFISKFPRSEIRNIKMLDYVPGKTVNGDADRETFAYLIEFGSRNFGAIGGGSAKKFAIYMGKKLQEPVYPPTFASADAAYNSTINLIADCVNHAENFIKTKDWKKFSDIITQIAESQTGTPSIPVISKIIAMYYPDEFLRIWSHQWLNKILDLFQVNRDDLPETGKEGRFYEKMQRVIEAKNSHPIMKEWSNKYFSYTIGEYLEQKKSEKSESTLLKFLKYELRKNMKANYQPIVIKTLLEKGSPFTVSIKEIRKKFDELNFGRMSYTKASGRPGGNDAISSVAGALKKFVKFPEGTSQGNATLNDGVVNSAEIPECLKICGQEIARWHIEKIVEDDYNLWRMPPGSVKDDYPYEREFLESNTIGVGWGRIGDDVVEKNMTKEQTEELFHKKYPPTPEDANSPQAFTNFTHEMKPKDIIVLIKKKTIVDFAIVVGPNRYQKDSSIDLPDNAKSYSHRRDVAWLNRGNIPEETFEFSRMSTCDRVANPERKEEYINVLLEEERKKRLFGTKTKGSITTQEYQKYIDVMEWKQNLILYGPPGTGKTWKAKQIAKEFIRLHNNSNEANTYSNISGKDNWFKSLKDQISSRASDWKIDTSQGEEYFKLKSSSDEKRIFVSYGNKNNPDKDLVEVGIKEKATSWLKEIPSGSSFVLVINMSQNSFVVLPYEVLRKAKFRGGENWDSSGETKMWFNLTVTSNDSILNTNESVENGKHDCSEYLFNIDQVFTNNPKFVTFHQSYSYEEFVEGIKVKVNEDKKYVTYEVEAGIFKEFCDYAKGSNKKYVLIIDEINRGNISKVFGELITILENDKRGDKVTLAYSKKPFFVPKNVYVIGTMNTADQSIARIDIALRRRFAHEELMPDSSALKNKDIDGINLTKLLDAINEKILDDNMREKQIGHSYLMSGTEPIDNIKDLQMTFAYNIIPLLREYYFDNDSALQELLNEEFLDWDKKNVKEDWKEDSTKFKNSIKNAFPTAMSD